MKQLEGESSKSVPNKPHAISTRRDRCFGVRFDGRFRHHVLRHTGNQNSAGPHFGNVLGVGKKLVAGVDKVLGLGPDEVEEPGGEDPSDNQVASQSSLNGCADISAVDIVSNTLSSYEKALTW